MPTHEMRPGPPHPRSKIAAVAAGGSYFLIKPADGIRTLWASLLHTSFCSNARCFPCIRGHRVLHM